MKNNIEPHMKWLHLVQNATFFAQLAMYADNHEDPAVRKTAAKLIQLLTQEAQ